MWNSALDGLRDSSLSSFFQLNVGKKKFLYYVFSSLFFPQSNTHTKTWSAFVIFYLLLIFLFCSLIYKHINMLNPIHIIFLFFEDIYFCLFIYLWIFWYLFKLQYLQLSERAQLSMKIFSVTKKRKKRELSINSMIFRKCLNVYIKTSYRHFYIFLIISIFWHWRFMLNIF